MIEAATLRTRARRVVARKRWTPVALILLAGFAAVAATAATADQNDSASASIYKCRTKTGGTALVSKIDSSLTDCVKLSDYMAGPRENRAAPADEAAEVQQPAPSAARKTHPETQDEHDARIKQMAQQIKQWCTDNTAQKPKEKQKDKDKALQECVTDKMGTYQLLYP